jgi:hypothetical protein
MRWTVSEYAEHINVKPTYVFNACNWKLLDSYVEDEVLYIRENEASVRFRMLLKEAQEKGVKLTLFKTHKGVRVKQINKMVIYQKKRESKGKQRRCLTML